MNRTQSATLPRFGVLLALLLAVAGCNTPDGEPVGNNILELKPRLNLEADGRPLLDGGTVVLSGFSLVPTAFEVLNTGNGDLVIEALTVTSDPPGALVVEHASLPFTVVPNDAAAGQKTMPFQLSLADKPAPGAPLPTGELTITTNYQVDGTRTFSVAIEVGTQPPALVAPGVVDLGTVVSGSVKDHPLTLTNAGGEPLVVTELEMDADEAFSLPEGAVFDPPLVIAEGTSAQVTLRYAPEFPEPATGDIIVHSNDPAQPAKLIAIQANVGGPCISVSPLKLDFGGKYVGGQATSNIEITSCGDEALTIDRLEFLDGSSGTFVADLQDLTLPISVPTNKTVTIPVIYTPDVVAELGEDGFPVRDTATFVIGNNSLRPEFEVDVSGWGADTDCPTPVIRVEEGEEVIPQTILHLDGTQSFAPTGGIEAYEWSVTAPPGSVDVFLPSASAPAPTFAVNVAGTYVFELKVRDEAGTWSGTGDCQVAASYTVLVVPDDAIHVELLWHTPGDPDETDIGPEAGADMDLHLLHPFAMADGGAGWFHPLYDAFWFNGNPNWGSFDPFAGDDPSLDLDDTDGGGPENMNLNKPENGLSYRVGVHYWDHHGFGSSEVTVRIYIHSVLVFEIEGIELTDGDLWNVADIAWPSGQVTPNKTPGGQLDITPDYPTPFP